MLGTHQEKTQANNWEASWQGMKGDSRPSLPCLTVVSRRERLVWNCTFVFVYLSSQVYGWSINCIYRLYYWQN